MYVVRGLMRYRDIERHSYLEMWNVMPDGRRYFSRRPVVEGNFFATRRSSDGWQQFELPFNLMGTKPSSVTLEINVIMPPGKGIIELSGLTICDIQTTAWFDQRTGNMLGAWLGVSIGLFGGLFGCLAGFLVPRGKGRRLVMGMFIFAVFIGITLLLVGILALCLGQHFYVWYPFMLCGGITVLVFPGCFMAIKKQYAQSELRKMQALDV